MSALFASLDLGGLTLPNRIVVSPMCQYSAEDGKPGAWHLMHLGTLAVSGAGMLCLEGTAVEPQGRITPGDLGLWDDTTEAAFRPVLDALRRFSPIFLAIQLAHAGRKGSSHRPWDGGGQILSSDGGWLTDAPSAIAHAAGEEKPVAFDRQGLARIRAAFAGAATRAAALGFDAIEIHGAHGYLLHAFLSPLSNRRTDEYGGSFANRIRFPLEVFDAVRERFPADKPVGMKLSATDWMPDGWDLEQTVAFAGERKSRGAAWITASSGGISPAQAIAVGPGYQVPFATAIRLRTGLPTTAVGLITEAKQAEDIVSNGQADLVALARAMLFNPRWPWHAAAELGATVSAPPAYWRSQPHGQSGLFGAEARVGAR